MTSGSRSGPRRGRGRGVPVTGYSRTRRIDAEEGDPQNRPIPESALYPVVARHLARAGFTCWRDVSFLGVWIDLYARHSDGRTVAVELKVEHWQAAVRQALRVRNAAHRTYVALWAPFVHRVLTPKASGALQASGLGLLSVNGACNERLPARERAPKYPSHVQLPKRPSHRPR